MAGALEQFVAFGTDIVGLERSLRLLQSILLITTWYPDLFSAPMDGSPMPLVRQLNLTRRAVRLFWFLKSFQASWRLFVSRDRKSIETWLDVLAQSMLGMFGLLESLTLVDLAGALSLLGPVEAVALDAQAQVLWFVALYTSALASAARLLRLLALRAVPETGDGFGAALAHKPSPGSAVEPAKRNRRASRRKEQNKSCDETNAKAGALGRKLLVDLLDLVIPASNIGWLKVHGGLVGVAMFCSTVLTSIVVWDRCRQHLHKASA